MNILLSQTKFIEKYNWTELFKGDIISFTTGFVFVIIGLHIVSILIVPKMPKAYIYFIKAIIYAILVILMGVYFNKTNNPINVFTGFTFLFSAVEVADNIGSCLEEIFGNNVLFRNRKNLDFQNEESAFFEYIGVLENLNYSISVGKVNGRTKSYVAEVMNIFHNKTINFFSIERIISNSSEKRIVDNFYRLITLTSFKKIDTKNVYASQGKLSKSIFLSEDECDELKKCLEEAIELKNIYLENKNQLEITQKNLNNLQ